MLRQDLTVSKMQMLNQLVNNACDAIDLLRDYAVMSGMTEIGIEWMEDQCERAKSELRRLQWEAEDVREVWERDTEPNDF